MDWNVRRNAEIPFIAELTHLEKDGAAVFYDAEISGQSVRVAALRIQLAHGEHLLVQFAQTLQQRSALTSRIVKETVAAAICHDSFGYFIGVVRSNARYCAFKKAQSAYPEPASDGFIAY